MLMIFEAQHFSVAGSVQMVVNGHIQQEKFLRNVQLGICHRTPASDVKWALLTGIIHQYHQEVEQSLTHFEVVLEEMFSARASFT